MMCDNCKKELDALKVCSKCKVSKYCSVECQTEDWKNVHKTKCFDRTKLKNVLNKAERKGLIRHVNGNTLDNRISNLQRVSVKDAFQNKDWTVDAVCVLSDEEYDIWCKSRELLVSL